jgi:hypothetical protein
MIQVVGADSLAIKHFFDECIMHLKKERVCPEFEFRTSPRNLPGRRWPTHNSWPPPKTLEMLIQIISKKTQLLKMLQ